jgi:hypothetical protein
MFQEANVFGESLASNANSKTTVPSIKAGEGLRRLNRLALLRRVEGERKPAPAKRPRDGAKPARRKATRHGGRSDRMLDDSTFRCYFQRIGLNAGYYGGLTIHALRRTVANEVDSKIP